MQCRLFSAKLGQRSTNLGCVCLAVFALLSPQIHLLSTRVAMVSAKCELRSTKFGLGANFVGFDHLGANFDQPRARCVHCLVGFDQPCAELDHFRPRLSAGDCQPWSGFRQLLARFGHFRVRFDQCRARVGQTWAGLGQIRACFVKMLEAYLRCEALFVDRFVRLGTLLVDNQSGGARALPRSCGSQPPTIASGAQRLPFSCKLG